MLQLLVSQQACSHKAGASFHWETLKGLAHLEKPIAAQSIHNIPQVPILAVQEVRQGCWPPQRFHLSIYQQHACSRPPLVLRCFGTVIIWSRTMRSFLCIALPCMQSAFWVQNCLLSFCCHQALGNMTSNATQRLLLTVVHIAVCGIACHVSNRALLDN